MLQRRYYITGFMGSGKTTVGEALAEQLQLRVIDLDQWIEKKNHKEITDIFAEKGESYFRELETNALKEVNGDNLIITTGGGIVTMTENRQFMKENGTIIYLKCEMDEIFRRLEGDETRPNFRGDQEQIKELFMERQSYYEEAHIIIDTTGKSIAQIVTELRELLNISS